MFKLITGRFGVSSSYSSNVNAPSHSIDKIKILQMDNQIVSTLLYVNL